VNKVSNTWTLSVIAVLGAALFSSSVWSALPIGSQLPGAQQQRSIETERRRKQDEKLFENKPENSEEIVDTEKVEPKVPEVTETTGPFFLLKQIKYTSSDIFSNEELDAFSKDYINQKISFSEVQKLVIAINAEYYDRGFITAQAVIPAQKLKEGVLDVNLIEGHVGRVLVQGNDSTKASYIERRIGQSEGDLFELQPLQDSLLYFNKTNDVQLTSELEPGQNFGETDIKVEAYEPKKIILEFFGDNTGSKSTGEYRGGVNFENKSLFGYRDNLKLSGTKSSGSREYSINYSVPVNKQGGRLGVFYYKSDINITDGALSNLNVGGESTLRQYDYSQPVFINELWKIDGVAQVQDRHAFTDVDKVKIISSEIINPSLGINIEKEDESGIWFSSHNFHRFRAEASRARAYYSKYRFSLARTQAVSDVLSGYFNLVGQYTSDDLLPSSEQMQIGGSATVRGYPEGAYIGDKGYYSNFELMTDLPMLQSEKLPTENRLQGFIFVDHGGVFTDIPTKSETQSDFITSSGLGVRLGISDYISANAAVAWGFNDHADQKEPRLHVRVSVIPTGR